MKAYEKHYISLNMGYLGNQEKAHSGSKSRRRKQNANRKVEVQFVCFK